MQLVMWGLRLLFMALIWSMGTSGGESAGAGIAVVIGLILVITDGWQAVLAYMAIVLVIWLILGVFLGVAFS